MSILVVLAGPNGSGKTSLYAEVAASPYFPDVFVSPDAVVASGKYANLPTIRDQYIAAMQNKLYKYYIIIYNQTPIFWSYKLNIDYI